MDLVREPASAARPSSSRPTCSTSPSRPARRPSSCGRARSSAPPPLPSSAVPKALRATGRCWHELMSRRSVAAEGGQLRALLSLRWRMLRTPRQRRALVAALLMLPVLAVAAVLVGQLAPENLRLNFATIAPTVFASFFALAVISPASSAGGSELFPSDQLAAYPVRDRTVFRSTVLLAPANLAWMTSFLALLGHHGVRRRPRAARRAFRGDGARLLPVRDDPRPGSRLVLRGSAAAAGGTGGCADGAAVLVSIALAIQLSGNLTDFLDRLPTTRIALSANFGAQGRYVSVGDTGPGAPGGRRDRALARRTSLRVDSAAGQRRRAPTRDPPGPTTGRRHQRPQGADADRPGERLAVGAAPERSDRDGSPPRGDRCHHRAPMGLARPVDRARRGRVRAALRRECLRHGRPGR